MGVGEVSAASPDSDRADRPGQDISFIGRINSVGIYSPCSRVLSSVFIELFRRNGHSVNLLVRAAEARDTRRLLDYRALAHLRHYCLSRRASRRVGQYVFTPRRFIANTDSHPQVRRQRRLQGLRRSPRALLDPENTHEWAIQGHDRAKRRVTDYRHPGGV